MHRIGRRGFALGDLPAAELTREREMTTALGACPGGNGTLIRASANVVVSKNGERNGCNIGEHL
ncbi:hypothetical protein KKF84_14020 [Myxococcota bacterium]|nr:hypothetical protein [Myxococcota bacterium]